MKRFAPFVRQGAIKFARALHDAWIIVGVTVALIMVLELGYRAQRMIRAARPARVSSSEGPANPFDAYAWAPAYRADQQREEQVQWQPYLYIRNPPFKGYVVTVDSLGHRVTLVQRTSAARSLSVFFLGGSTTFGWYQRDGRTLPSEASARLQSALGLKARVEPTNFGVPGRIFTQEILELILQLKSGAKPDIVIFYDGINDVMATAQNGKAGIPQNEANRAEDFMRGRALAEAEKPGISNDLVSAQRGAKILANSLEFVRRIRGMKSRPSGHAGQPASASLLAKEIVGMYAANVQLVEALAKEYGFQAIYVWQPALLSTQKRLTKREKWLAAPGDADPEIRLIRDVQRAVPTIIGDTMRPIVGDRFIDDTRLFDADSAEVYVDLFGHTYESANPPIAASLMPQLSAAALRALH